ncbi:MAG: T9SS type A sorting domain-containing protein [Bacteroidia bacterium]
MKKIYLLGFAALFFSSVNAQTSRITAVEGMPGKKGIAANKSNNPNSVNAIQAVLTSNTFYAAGTTMNLSFNLTLTNTDAEYGDSLSITLPAGFTINSVTPNDSLGVTEDPANASGCPVGANSGHKEPFRGILPGNQTAVWGDNDNCYGGISTTQFGGNHAITLNVTIAPGVTGTQVANFFVSGDQFANPADFAGTTNILPVGASVTDLTAKIGGVQGTSFCNNTMLPIAVRIVNNGTNPESNFPVAFKIDNNAPVVETVTVTVAPGDSTDYFFTAMGDFTAEADYVVKVYTDITGDSNHGNDTIASTWTNTVVVPLTSTTYTNGFETAADLVGIRIAPNPGSVANWGLSTSSFHSGARALFLTGGTAIADAWLLLKCMDVVNGETYNVSYWTRTNVGFNGGISISYGSTQDAAGMTTQIKPLVNNTPNATVWAKDSANFTATSSGTIYIGFRGQGTAAGSGTNVRLDDIYIHKVVPVGISKANSNNEMALYPNPTSGVVTLTVANANSQVEIFSIIGEKVYSKSQLNKGNNMLDLSNVAEGTYIVRVLSNGEIATKRITISK